MQPLRWAPVVENPSNDPGQSRFLARDPLSILEEGTFKSVPTVLGVNSREGLLWLTGKAPRTVARLLQRFDLDFSLVVRDLPFVWRRGREPSAAQVHRAALLIRGFFFGRQRIAMRTLPTFLDVSDGALGLPKLTPFPSLPSCSPSSSFTPTSFSTSACARPPPSTCVGPLLPSTCTAFPSMAGWDSSND
ncbi:uncharacterized protein LOC113203601 [Frankliniella occidentalis]|uniref:Uncharacterized protein LOC113203601 n=1 Tax=Frankliniella occidentalis TaxID=133901 RepID=A0A9C6XCC8_FRAOC|nr:uncharacterized protein LOC113203601 [Frankliniella occidentalis]